MESKSFLKGYTIGYGYDEQSGKYYLVNKKTNEVTRPFIDEVLFSIAPLETWVADYLVVRIGEYYYIADCEGNCYFEESTPFIICRNVFVQGEKKYIVDKNLKKQTFGYDIHILEYQEYKYATLKCDTDGYHIIKATGGYNSFFIEKKPISSLDEWYIHTVNKRYETVYRIFNEDFDIIQDSRGEISGVKLIGKKSKTLKIRYYSSSILFSSVLTLAVSNIYVFDEFEVVICNGKTYFFKPNGEIECEEGEASEVMISNKLIVYRNDMNIIVKSIVTGEVTQTQTLSPNEFYKALMDEKMMKLQSKAKNA